LRTHYAAACQGQRQCVFITGEAGIGKTTLVDAFVAQVQAMEPVWLGRGQCIEQYGAGEAYLPLMLRELAEVVEVLTTEQPLLLVLEDVHWSDVSTLDWLAYVARRRGLVERVPSGLTWSGPMAL
jgi:predicted ATPase